jgi:hypothetical protein
MQFEPPDRQISEATGVARSGSRRGFAFPRSLPPGLRQELHFCSWDGAALADAYGMLSRVAVLSFVAFLSLTESGCRSAAFGPDAGGTTDTGDTGTDPDGRVGTPDGSDGADASDGAVGETSTSAGTITLRLIIPSSRAFCDQVNGCTAPAHISISASSGHTVNTTLAGIEPSCSPGCVQPVGGACLPPHGEVVTTPYDFQWEGVSYGTSTCGAGITCYESQFVPAGHYVAHMCATPGTFTVSDGGDSSCAATGATECVDVPFDLPGPSPVLGTLP